MFAVFDVTLPIFGLILIGYVAGRTPILGGGGARTLSDVCFYVTIPVLLFRAGARLASGGAPEAGTVVAFFAGAAVAFVVALALWRFGFRRPADEAAIAGMASSYPNNLLMGIPLSYLAFGDQGVAVASAVIALSGLVFYSVTTILVEVARSGRANPLRAIMPTAKSLVRNPIIIGMAAGLAFGATGLPLPTAIDRLTGFMADSASPMALIALGASLVQYRIGRGAAEAGTAAAVKLVVHPLATWAVAVAIGIGPASLGPTVLMAALPVGVNGFLMAQRYGVFVDRAGAAIVLSMLGSVATLAVVIAAFG